VLVGGKWFWCCKDNIIFPLRHHRTARVFPTPRAFSVRPPHSARSVASNCAHHPSSFTSSAPSSVFSCFSPPPFGTKRRTSGTFHSKFPVFHPKFPIFVHLLPRFAARLAQHTRLVPFAHFSSPSAVGDRSETHKFHLLMHHILRRRCAFPLPLSLSPVISHHMLPSPRLLASFAFKILLQLVQSLLTRPSSPIASSANSLSPGSSTRLFPHLSETHLRDMTQKLTIRTIIRCLSSHFAIQILPLSCKIRRTLQKCEEKAWRIGIKALALPKDDRKLGCLNVNNVQSAVRNRQNRLSPDPQA